MTNQPLTNDSLVYCKPLPYADDEQVGMENLSQWIHKDNVRSAVEGMRNCASIISLSGKEELFCEYCKQPMIDATVEFVENGEYKDAHFRCWVDEWFPVFAEKKEVRS